MSRNIRRGWLILLVVLGLASFPSASPAQPATEDAAERQAPDVPPGDGSIRGRVVDDSGAALPSVEVALYALSSEGVPGLRRGVTDASGVFVFDKIARSSNLAYLVGARVQNVPYPGARISFEPGQTEHQVEIVVSGLTAAGTDLTPSSAELRLQRSPGGARAVQTLRVENRGAKTFYVPAEQRAAGTPALRARLPEGATDFEMPLGVIPEGVEVEGRDVLWWGPIHPGSQDLSFSYQIANEGPERLSSVWTLPAGASEVRLWIPSGGTLEGDEFRAADLPQGTAPGLSAYDGSAASPGQVFRIALTLPAATVVAGGAEPTEVRAMITSDDAALAVTETHTLHVPGSDRALGTQEEPLYRIPLPEGVARLRFGASGPSLSLLPDDQGGLMVLGEADPGEVRVELSYRLSTSGFPASFERRFDRRIPLFSIYLADHGQLLPSSDRLHRRRPVRTPDLTYMHLEAFEVAAEEVVSLTIDRQSPRLHAPDWLQRSSVALAGGLVVALLITPLWGGGRNEPTKQAHESAAERERLGVLAALRDLEHDYETGKIEAQDYEGVRQELRQRALTLMRQARSSDPKDALDTSVPEPEAAQTEVAEEPAFCTQCGAGLERGDHFCGQCGTRRAQGDAAEPA